MAVTAASSEDCGESIRIPLRSTSLQGLPPPDLFRSSRGGDLRFPPETCYGACRSGGGGMKYLLVRVGAENGKLFSIDIVPC